MILNLPFFGDLNSESLQDYYDKDVIFGSAKIQLDLNFYETSIDEDKLSILKQYLNDLEKVVELAKKEINSDFKGGENVVEFLEHHIDVLDETELEAIIDTKDKSLSVEQRLLSALKLMRIGFYPEDDDFAIFDFTLGEEISQYLLVVKFNNQMQLQEITMES
ncbi:DUF2004 domain-containing protein [Mucilaginibacter agri]|uniref:DUF2004 domain-containing protein n=1 Tax=Mucilaginibacter agri TaxID=2695265 RepID=A0A965ZEA3_9SPHI|nr:DUF2004 domain-containing protein [Mucilaginibacter agri]NCD68487.1 DUF2004 domain-containing protein [Mucilaginibacter agri]